MLSRLLFLGFAMLFSWSLQAQFPCLSGDIGLYPGEVASFCDPGSGEPAFIRFRARPMGVPRAYVVVNSQDEIVHIGYSGTINFVGLGTDLRVYSFTLVGSITAEIGDNINDTQLASGCSELSSNSIEIMMDNGGQVGGTLSGGPFEFCVGDAEPDFISEGSITLTGEVAENTSWVVTDSNGNILGLPPSPYAVDFDGAGSGTCNIYNVSYQEGLQGLEVDANISDLMGCFDLSNAVEVNRNQPVGGNIYTENGNTFNRVVVANRLSGTISVIDSDNNELLDTYEMPDDGEPMYVVYNDDNQTILVGDYNGKVVAFDALDFSISGQADAGLGVFHMWASPDNQQLWVNNELDRTISVINPTTMENLATVELPTDLFDAGYKPHDVIIMPNNAAAFVTLLGPGEEDYVIKYDASTFLETARAAVGTDPHVSVTSANDNLYVASQGSGEVKVLLRSDLSEVTTVSVPNAHGLGMNADGTYLYIGNISDGGVNATYTLDLATNMLVDDPVDAPFAAPHNYAVTSDNAQLFLTHSGSTSDQVSVYSLSPTPTLVTTITVEGNPFGLAAYTYIERTEELTICAGDGVSDAFDVTLDGNSGSNSQWVITDSDLNILALPMSPPFDLEGAGAGVCLIWHLSYEEGLTGLEEGLNAGDLEGCFSLSNAITVNRNQATGGTLEGGPFTFCVGDGVPDLIAEDAITLSGNMGDNSQWVVTDSDGNILGLPPTFSVVDFDGAGLGTCVVYHLSYTDGIEGLVADANIADLMGCFDLSNGIDVNRNQPEGGTLEGGPFSFCVGDGVADLIGEDEIILNGNSGPNAQWVVTDADGNILGLPPTFSVVDFDGAGSGTCVVYHLSYVDGLEGLAEDANIADLAGCFDLSNGIDVNRGENTASSLVGGPFDFCTGNFDPDFIPEGAITLNEGSGDNSSWIITDADGTILGLPPSPYVVDFDFAGGGSCLIYHINYVSGLVGLAEEANIADLDGCFLLSNAITVNRTDPDAGVILGGPYTFCVGDGLPDMLDESAINIVGGAVDNVFWIVTDIDDNIIGTPPSFTDVDFDGAGTGTCYIRRVTGVFDEGVPGLEVGTNLDDLQGCFALSNRVTIIRTQPEGGVLEGGPFTFCVADGVADMIAEEEIALSGNTGTNSQWVVTDADGNILGLPPTFTAVDFDGAGEGACIVYHLSYEDGLEGLEGEMNIANFAGCFDLSNGITVNRNTPIGGTLEGGPFSFCVSDNIPDMLEADAITLSGNSGSNSQWIVTDANGNILGLPPMPSAVDFDGAGEGACLIYNLSYEDGIEGLEGDLNIADLAGCFALSNAITVERTAVNGGAVTTTDGETSVDVTVNDGIDDIILFMSTNAIGENFTYVITDADNMVLAIPESNAANFEGAGVGVCRVWGLAYTGELLLQEGDIVGQVAPSEGCFAISDIFITVNRTEGGLQLYAPTGSNSFSSVLDVQLYPNPAINQLQVRLTNNQASSIENAVELMVVQLDGKLVYRNTIGAGQLQSTVDVSQLPAGAYFIRINDGEQIVTKRFVKAN